MIPSFTKCLKVILVFNFYNKNDQKFFRSKTALTYYFTISKGHKLVCNVDHLADKDWNSLLI